MTPASRRRRQGTLAAMVIVVAEELGGFVASDVAPV